MRFNLSDILKGLGPLLQAPGKKLRDATLSESSGHPAQDFQKLDTEGLILTPPGDTSPYEQDYQRARDLILQPPPTIQSPEIDPIEAIAAAFAGSQSSLPSEISRAANAPYTLAAGRADTANANAIKQYEFQQAQGAQLGNLSLKMIGEINDREALNQKLEADAAKAKMVEEGKNYRAQASNNVQLVQTLAKLGDKSNPQSIAAIIREQNPTWDEEIVQRKAYEIYQDSQINPSFAGQIDKAKLDLEQQEFDLKRVEQDQDLLSDTGATLTQKLGAVGRLQRSGHLPEGDPLAIAKELSLDAEKKKAEITQIGATTAQIEERTKLIRAQTGITDEKAKQLAIETRHLDAKIVAQIAKIKADTENAKSLVSNRNKEGTFDRKAFEQTALRIGQSETALISDLNGLRNTYRQQQKEYNIAAEGDDDKIKAERFSEMSLTSLQITELEEQLKTIREDKDAVTKKLLENIKVDTKKKKKPKVTVERID